MTDPVQADLASLKEARQYPVIGPADDDFHDEVLSDRWWETETNWFSWNVPDRKLGGWLHATCHTNRETVTWRVYVWDPTGARPNDLAYYRISPDTPMPATDADLRDITFPGGGFGVKMPWAR